MFNGAPTLLLAGSTSEMDALRCALQEWDGSTISLAGVLRPSIPVHVEGISELVLEGARSDRTESIAVMECDKAIWKLSVSKRDRIVGLLKGLCRGPDAGHQYLDSGTSPMQLLCSKGEY